MSQTIQKDIINKYDYFKRNNKEKVSVILKNFADKLTMMKLTSLPTHLETLSSMYKKIDFKNSHDQRRN